MSASRSAPALPRVVFFTTIAAAGCATGVAPGGYDPDGVIPFSGTGGSPGSGGGAAVGAGGRSGSGGSRASGGVGTSPSAGGSGSGGTPGAGGGTSAGGRQGAGGAAGVDAGPPPTGDLQVQYKAPDSPTDNQLKPHFNVLNRGTEAVPLSELTIRYWYTADATAPTTTDYQELTVDYADIGRLTNGRTTVALSFGRLMPPEPTADHYIEVAFRGPDSLEPGAATNPIEIRVNWKGYSPSYDETDDYSWDGSKTSFTVWQKVTLYRRGFLVWGIEPDGTTPSPPSDGGTDGSDGAPADAGGTQDSGPG